jgi:O-antigen/teichoic acid export membrane protein
MALMRKKLNAAMSYTADFAGRILKTDGRYLLRGGFWSLIGQGAAVVSSLALAVIVSRYVPKDVYGEYKYALAVVGFLSIFSLNDLSTAVFQSVSSGFDGALMEGFRINLRWSVLVIAGAVSVAAYYFFAHNLALAFCVLLGGCVMPLQNSSNLFMSFLAGKRDFARNTIYANIIGNIIPVALLIVTALWMPNLIALISVYFLGNLAVDLCLFLRTIQVYKPDPEKKDPAMKVYGLHLSAIGILSGVAGSLDQILLFHFVSAADLAIYAFSIGILDQIKGPLKMLDSMMQARFAGRNASDITSGIGNKMFWMFVTAVAVIGTYYVAAPWIYKLLFPTYTASISYSRLYALSYIGITYYPISSYFVAKKMVWEQYVSILGGSMVQIALITIGTIGWGLWGLIAGRVLASWIICIAVIGMYLFRNKGPRAINS